MFSCFKRSNRMESCMKKFISCILVMLMTISFFGILPANAESDSLEPNTHMETDISVQGTNSFGNLMTNELTAEMDKQEENNGCNIFSIEMNGKEATVSFETAESCTLVVAVYSEYNGNSEKMLASGSTTVAKGETETLVTIDTDNMPQYYYLCGFLVDSDTLRPLCTAYESPNYTQEMQEFFSKTVNDFDSEKVLNLDDDESNNFAVFSDETIIVEQSGAVNRVIRADDNARTYVIANADSTVKSLQNGDIFTCKNGDETLIVKVDKISLNGSSVTVKGQDTSMEDVFDYVKIDTTPVGVQTPYTIANQRKSRAISLNPEQSFTTTVLDIPINKYLSGKIKNTFSVSLKVYIAKKYQYIEAKIGYSIESALSIYEGFDIPIISSSIITIPTPLGINVSIDFSVQITAGGKLEYTHTISGQFGISYDSDTKKVKSLNSSPTLDSELKAEAELSISFSIIPNINIINSAVANISLEKRLGQYATVTKSIWHSQKNNDSKHECKTCLDGEVSIKDSVSCNIEILKQNVLNREIIESKSKICDFYYSFDNDEFGWGKCPHMLYRVNVRVVDTNGNPISNASVTKDNAYMGKTDSNGNLEVWLSNGGYTLTAKKDDAEISRDITVCNNAKSTVVILDIKSKDYIINFNDIYKGELEKNECIHYYEMSYITSYNGNGTLFTVTTNNSDGVKGGFELPVTKVENGVYYYESGFCYDRNMTTEERMNVVSGLSGTITVNSNGSLLWETKDSLPYELILTPSILEKANWKQLYVDELRRYMNSDEYKSNPMFDLYDIDGNNIPELFISSGTMLGESTKIYTVNNEKLINLKVLNRYNKYSPNKKVLYSYDLMTGNLIFNYNKLEPNILVNLLGGRASDANNYYMLNGEIVTSEEYNKEISKYESDDYISIGRKYNFDEESIKSMLLNEEITISILQMNDYSVLLSYLESTYNQTQSPTFLTDEEYGTSTIWGATSSYRGLIPNETYNFYAMKSKTAENLLSSDNLLYITQVFSDSNGNLEIPYTAKEQYDNAVTFVKAASKTDLSSAKVTIPDILCDGTERFAESEVILNGKTLTEGIDYDIEKHYSAIYPGEYELIITGIRNYTGEIKEIYNVYCEHSFVNSKCKFCKSLKDSVGDANGDGVVGVADLTALQDFLLAKRKYVSINADINQDKVIDVFDMCLLRQIVSQLIA